MTREEELAAIEAFVAEGSHTVYPQGMISSEPNNMQKKMILVRKNARKQKRKGMVVAQERRRKDVKVEL